MKPIYLDHAATTPVRDEVRAAMTPYSGEQFGNPSSLHAWGRTARAALEGARATVAESLGARPGEIYFVRGGTESDNLAVAGACMAQRAREHTPALVVSTVEHSAVLECADGLAAAGLVNLAMLDVSAAGDIDLDAPARFAARGPCTVSVMWVNNETGLVLPVPALAERLADSAAVLHTDASQAVGKIPIDVRDTPVDLLTATGHKINGPKGVGVLYVRDGTPLRPLLRGGGQERALRPGTEDVAGAVGFAEALRLAVEERPRFAADMNALRADFEGALSHALPDLRINCGEAERAPHVSSIGVADIADAQALLMALDLEGLAVSGGSACHSGAGKGSHVIEALFGGDDAMATLRFSFGRQSTTDETSRAVEITTEVVERLRAMSVA